MRTMIESGLFFLVITGGFLTEWLYRGNQFLSLVHIYLGLAYFVIFILYTIDHLVLHRKMLGTSHWKSLTGTVQLFLASLVLISGIMLYLYSSKPISPWIEIHLWSSIFLAGVCAFHFSFK